MQRKKAERRSRHGISIRDYVPDGSTKEGEKQLKTIFELAQYKFIFHQDSNVLPVSYTHLDLWKTDCRNDQRELWKSLLSADKLIGNLKKFLEYAR